MDFLPSIYVYVYVCKLIFVVRYLWNESAALKVFGNNRSDKMHWLRRAAELLKIPGHGYPLLYFVSLLFSISIVLQDLLIGVLMITNKHSLTLMNFQKCPLF